GLDEDVGHRATLVVQPVDEGGGERLSREGGAGLAPPQVDGVVERLDRATRIPGFETAPSLSGETLEDDRVDLVMDDTQDVAGCFSHEHCGWSPGARSGSRTRRRFETYACND